MANADAAHFPSVVTTRAGAYPPVSYLLPGLALRAADDPFTADRVARLVAAASCYAFLLLGLALIASPGAMALSLLGPVAAVTPGALFVMASLNSSGPETAAGFAFFAALLRIARGGPVPRWVWMSAAVAGLVLATVRATGALWVVLDLAVFLFLVGTREARALGRRSTRVAAATIALVIVSVVGNRVWEQVQGTEVTQQAGLGHASSGAFVDWLRPAVVQIPRILDEEVGVFGWVDTLMPGFAYILWQGMVAALLGVAFLVACRRERWTLVAATLLSLAVAVFLSAVLQTAGSGDVQGRHVLPFAVVVPLLAGETVLRNRHKLALVDGASLVTLFCVLTAFVQLVGWHASAQRQSVGSRGPLWFLPHAQWTPPGGWPVWAATAVIGSLLLALAGTRRTGTAH